MSERYNPAPGFEDEWAQDSRPTTTSEFRREGYAPSTEEDTKTRWGDYGRALGTGTLGVASAIPTLAEYATQGEVGGDMRRYLEGKSEELTRGMTPVGKRSMNAAILPTEGQESMFDVGVGSSLGLQTTAALPSLIASIIPGGIAGRIAKGASEATRLAIAGGAARGSAAVMNAGDVTQQIFSTLDDMSDKELMKSPAFKGYIDSGMEPAEARKKFYTDVAGVTPFLAGGISALLAAPEAELAGRLAGGEIAKKGALKGAISMGLGEAKEEGIESGTGEFMTEQKLAEHNLGDRDWYNVLSKAVQGSAVGFGMGAGSGGVTHAGGAVKVDTVAPDQQTALQGQAGSQPAAQTVPEQPQTLDMQREALLNGQRPAMLYPKGTPELELPEGTDRLETPVGVIHYNPDLVDLDTVKQLATPDRINELEGYLQSKDQAAQQSAAQGAEPVAAVTRKNGVEVDAAVVSPDKAQEQLDILAQRAPAGSTQSVERPGDVVNGRMSAQVPEDIAAAMQPSKPAAPNGVGPAGQAILDQRQAPVASPEAADNIPISWDEEQDARDALAEFEAKWAGTEKEFQDAFDEIRSRNEPDLIQYDDGTTEEVKPLPLRGNKQPASGRSKGWMTPATEEAIRRAEANRAARNQSSPSEEPLSSVQTETAKPSTDAVLNPETKKVKVGGWEFDVGARDAIAVKKPGGDFINFYDRDQRKHYGRRGEAYLDEAADHGIPDVLQAKLSEYLKNKQTPEQFTESLNAPLQKQPSSSVQTEATSEVTDAIKPKRARRPAKQPAAQPDNGRVANSIPQLNDDSAKSRLKAATARIRNALSGRGRLKVSEVELPIADIVSQQDWIEPSRKEPALATNEPPVVVHVGGKFVLRDGNHRVSAMIDRGDTTAKVRLVELDPYGNSETTTAEPAKKAVRNKAPGKTKSENALTTVATTEPTTENNTPSGVIRPVYVGVAERLANKKRVSAEGSHEKQENQAARKRYAKAAEEAFYANQPGDDEVYEGAEQIDLLRPKDSMTGSRFVRSDKQRKAIRARIEKFLKSIEGAGHEIPAYVTKNSNNFQLYARVAKDLLTYLDGKSKAAQEAVDNFITDEQAAFAGDFEPMRKRRLEEGDLKSRPNNELNEDTTSGSNAGIGTQAFPAPDEIEDHLVEQRISDMKNAAREIIARQRQDTRSVDMGALYMELAQDFPDVIEHLPMRTQAEVEAALREASAKDTAPKEKSGGAIKTKKAEPAPVVRKEVTKEENDRLVALMDQLEANKSQPKVYTSSRDAEELGRRQLYSMENSDKADLSDLAEKVFGGAFGSVWTTSYRSTGDDVLDALQEASANGAGFDPFQEFAKTQKQQELFEKSPEEIKHQMMQEAVNRVREEFVEERDNEPAYPATRDRDGVIYYNHEKVQDPVVSINRVNKLLSVKLPGAHRSKLDDFIRNLVNRLAGDVAVVTLTDKDFNSVAQKFSAAFYDPGSETIVVPDNLFKRANFQAEQIILHEALHAALYHKVRGNNVAIHQLELLTDYLAKKGFMPGAYMYADVHEFLSEVLSRGDLQEGLRRIELTPELAQILGIEPWRAKNLWQAIVQTFAKWLGYVGPYNALEGVLSVTDRIVREDTSVPIEFAANTSDHYFDKRYDDYYGDSKPLGFGYERGPTKYYTNDGAVSKSEFGKGISRRGGRSRAGWGDQLPSIRQDDITSAVNDTTQIAKDHGQAFVNRMKRLAIAGVTLDQMRQTFKGIFVDKNGVDLLEKVVSAIQRMAPFAQKIREQSDELAKRFIELQKKDADGADEFTTLANDATNANVRLGPDPTNVNNKHLRNGGRNAQGKELLDRLQERYKALSPEWQQLYQDMSTYYRGVQNEHVRGIVDNRLKRYGIEPANRAQFIEKFVSGAELTNADKELFKNNEHALKRLKAVRELRVIQGDYFPLMRYGKFVVNTNQKIADHMGGVEIEPGKVEFRAKTDQAARAMAERFAGDVGLPQTNWQKSPLSQANDYGYIVSVQTRGAHFFESEAEAIAWRRQHANDFDEISEVSPIRETGQQGGDLTTAQLNSLQATVRNSNYSEEEKEDMLDMLQQGSAVLMSGNRIQKRSIARRKVMGASKDFGRNVVQYGEAVSNRLAQLKFRPEVDEALDGMREINKDLMDKRQPERTALINEITKRIDSNVVNAKEPGKFMKDLMTLTFLGKLASPMYSVINGMQPWMVTYPVLAGRYGPVRAASMLREAYGSIGFTEQALAGLKNTYLAGKNFNSVSILNTEDVVKSIQDKLKTQSDGTELNKVIDMLLERGAMSQGGFELAPSIAQGRSKFWGMPLARVDRIARQLPQAVEDVNRAVSAIAAYRLARASMSEEKAREFAFSTVMNTQGDYSGVNAPRFFNNPVLRPAVQFKKYAQMMVYLLADMTGKAFGPNTPREERMVAAKQIASIMGVQIAMAGSLSLPGIEIAKLGFMIAGALGVGGGWDDEEEKLRKLADETFGETWGQLLSRGVISRALNIDLSQRLSLADMATFGEPGDYERDGVDAYLWRMFAGAPYSTFNDIRLGINDAVDGDFGKAAGRIFPVKVISDAFKAANGYSEGKVKDYEVAMNIFGVKSGRQAEDNRKTGNNIRAREKLEVTHKELTDAYLKAKSAGERVKLRAKIIEFNKTAPLRQKVFPNSLDKVRQRIEAERVS